MVGSVLADDNILAEVIVTEKGFRIFLRPWVDDQPAGIDRGSRLLNIQIPIGNFNTSGQYLAGVFLQTLHIDEPGMTEHRVIERGGNIKCEHDVSLYPLGREDTAVHLQLQGCALGDMQRTTVHLYCQHGLILVFTLDVYHVKHKVSKCGLKDLAFA